MLTWYFLQDILEQGGVEVDEGIADFNYVLIYLMKQGMISVEFLSDILKTNFPDNEYISLVEVVNFVCSLGDYANYEADDVKAVVSALRKLV